MGTERDYDEIIAPMLAEVAKKCGELGMSIVARVEWEPNEAGITLKREEKVGVGQSMAEIAALSRGNVDSFCLEMVRRFDVSASIFLRSYAKKEVADEWKPIETAPKDGTSILVGAPEWEPELCSWRNDCWFRGWCAGGLRSDTYGPDFDPTHWMPLPPPPRPDDESTHHKSAPQEGKV